ncbi:UDP-N-acetylglucosamine 2-epimerase [uncultured Helicobacter sp.]|uniref:UDP-N-acetylglucosamine 2-epimerase n=1 Tax=uncultured Helicobacter sp. TaxID=175537 RepID=UPI00262BD1D0|nr:UDP-N-acetylglucosamine 2-epimerase [uncultured Helicobacter sp.]
MKKILAVSGIRSEYDILYPILKAFEKEGFDVCIAVANAHLSDIHGNTYKKIESDGFRIADKIDCLLSTDRLTQRSKGVGLLITALTQTAEREKPDFLLVLGDREESIATCVVGNYMDILTIHCGGGDPVYGNADDPIRFACSKLAHIHCTTTEQYAQNLLKIGEDEWRIVCSGNTSYANIANTPHLSRKELSDFLHFDIATSNYIVLLKHPLSSEVYDAYSQMQVAIESCAEFATAHNLKVVGIYPNTDPGSYKILEAIQEAEQKYSHIRFFKTLPREFFINLIRHTLALAGNSSMGILEAPFYKLPVVNIGNRQKGRLNAGNVCFVPHKKQDIIQALQKACFDESYRTQIANLPNPYGDENACERIVHFVKNIDTTQRKWYVKTQLC